MNTKYDKTADALYLRLNKGKVVKTLRLNDRLIIDLDGKSNVLGVEILNAKSQLAPDFVRRLIHNPNSVFA